MFDRKLRTPEELYYLEVDTYVAKLAHACRANAGSTRFYTLIDYTAVHSLRSPEHIHHTNHFTIFENSMFHKT